MVEQKRALILGVSGQDGTLLANHFIQEGIVKVTGLTRNSSKENMWRLTSLNILDEISLIEVNLYDKFALWNVLSENHFDYIFNLSSASSVGRSYTSPTDSLESSNITLYILEWLRINNSKSRFYQASSSEMFGVNDELPLTLESPMCPVSPYGVSKAYAHLLTQVYRKTYGLYVCSGVLFNHESALRTDTFFVKKVVAESVKISLGLKEKLSVGNLDVSRDFGCAREYVEAMSLILQNDKPRDYIICTGKSTKLNDIVSYVLKSLDLSEDVIEQDRSLLRPGEIKDIYGDRGEALKWLGWEPSRDIFSVLDEMIEEEKLRHDFN